MQSLRSLALLVTVLALSSLVPAHAALTSNSLTWNSLTANSLSTNSLTNNSLTINGWSPNAITTNGLTQFSSNFATSFLNQDGVKFGYRTGVAIDNQGVVRAVFDNGQRLAVAQIPLVTFANAAALQAQSGNTYLATNTSGSPTTNFSQVGGAGQVAASELEQSNVDLATEFSNMIVTQRSYTADSKVITTATTLLDIAVNLIPGG